MVAGVINTLAHLLRDARKLDEAEALFLRGLEILEARRGKNHPEVATALGNLAQVNYIRGDLAKAEARCLRALAIDEEKLGKDHPAVGRDLFSLSFVMVSRQKFAEARKLTRRALGILFLYRKRNGTAVNSEQHVVANYTRLQTQLGRTPSQITAEIQQLKREAGLEG